MFSSHLMDGENRFFMCGSIYLHISLWVSCFVNNLIVILLPLALAEEGIFSVVSYVCPSVFPPVHLLYMNHWTCRPKGQGQKSLVMVTESRSKLWGEFFYLIESWEIWRCGFFQYFFLSSNTQPLTHLALAEIRSVQLCIKYYINLNFKKYKLSSTLKVNISLPGWLKLRG